jgi:hypothetical protein
MYVLTSNANLIELDGESSVRPDRRNEATLILYEAAAVLKENLQAACT